MTEPVELSDESIRLRPPQRDDREAVYEAVIESLDVLGPWMPWAMPDYSIELTDEWLEFCRTAWEASAEYSFLIFDRATGGVLGSCGLNQLDRPNRRANLGYWIRKSWNRRGIATRAARLVARFGFQELQLERLEIVVALDNHASHRVAQKLGATKEGTARRRIRLYDKQHDAIVYSLIREEFDAQSSK